MTKNLYDLYYATQQPGTGFAEHSFIFPASILNQEDVATPYIESGSLNEFRLESHNPLSRFRELVAQIPEVAFVFSGFQSIPGGDILHIHTVIQKDDREVRRKIYLAEMALMERFQREGFNFSFHALSLDDDKLVDLLPIGELTLVYEKPATNAIPDKA